MILNEEGTYIKAWIQLDLGLIENAVETMDDIIAENPALTRPKLNLFENIHKARIGSIRRILHEENTALVHNDSDLEVMPYVRYDAILKLKEYISYAVQHLDNNLIPNCEDERNSAFLWRMKADFNRYIAEFSNQDENPIPFDEATKAYEQALQIAQEKLSAYDTIFLGIVVNYSLFKANFLHLLDSAIELATKTKEAYYTENETRSEEVPANEAEEEVQLIDTLEKNVATWLSETQGNN